MSVLLSIIMLFSGSSSINTWFDADAGSILGTVPVDEMQPARRIMLTGLNGLEFAPDGLSDCAEMNFYRVQAGLPYQFGDQPRSGHKGIGWRESNCRNESSVHTSCCWGYWQLHEDHFYSGSIFDTQCDARSSRDIDSDTPIEKQKQACSTKLLFDRDGWSPWR